MPLHYPLVLLQKMFELKLQGMLLRSTHRIALARILRDCGWHFQPTKDSQSNVSNVHIGVAGRLAQQQPVLVLRNIG